MEKIESEFNGIKTLKAGPNYLFCIILKNNTVNFPQAFVEDFVV